MRLKKRGHLMGDVYGPFTQEEWDTMKDLKDNIPLLANRNEDGRYTPAIQRYKQILKEVYFARRVCA